MAALYLGVVCAVALYLWIRHGSLSNLLRALGFGDTPLHDYQGFFYPMGKNLLQAARPIEGFLYSPFAALLFVPFAWLPYELSAWAWGGCLLLLTAALAHRAAALAKDRLPLALAGVALTIASVPVLHDLKFGQVSVLVVAALLGCAHLYERDRRIAAAACLAFAAALKFYPGLFLVYFAFKRDFRFVLVVVGFLFFAMLVLPTLVLGWHATLAFYAAVGEELAARFGDPISDINSQSLRSVLGRLLHGLPFASALITTLQYVSGLALLAVTYRLAQSPERHAARRAFLWLFVTTPFFVSTSWPHYFVYLPIVFTAIVAATSELTSRRARNVALLAAGLGAILVSVFFFDLVADRRLYVRSGTLFWSNALALVAAALVLKVRSFGSIDPAPPT